MSSRLFKLWLIIQTIIQTPKVTVLLEYFSIGVCSIRVNDFLLEYLDNVPYINQWASVIQKIHTFA